MTVHNPRALPWAMAESPLWGYGKTRTFSGESPNRGYGKTRRIPPAPKGRHNTSAGQRPEKPTHQPIKALKGRANIRAGFPSPKGAAQHQPRATPWETDPPIHQSPERARQHTRRISQPQRGATIPAQGHALGNRPTNPSKP